MLKVVRTRVALYDENGSKVYSLNTAKRKRIYYAMGLPGWVVGYLCVTYVEDKEEKINAAWVYPDTIIETWRAFLNEENNG